MANNQKTVQSAEATNDALLLVVNKALGYPRKGVQIGAGPHAAIQETWDGTGARPYGWTAKAVDNWVVSAGESHVPISDALATELQLPASQARLNVAERATLSAALVVRGVVDLEAKVALPKVSAAAATKAGAAQKQTEGDTSDVA